MMWKLQQLLPQEEPWAQELVELVELALIQQQAEQADLPDQAEVLAQPLHILEQVQH